MIEPSNTSTSGLAGGYGHSLAEGDRIVHQFQVLRRMDASRLARWCVQYFSWLDGSSTKVAVIDERDLLDPMQYVLYATADDMHDAYQRYVQKRGRL